MASWDDVRRLATALPSVEEGTAWGTAAWRVAGKSFVWERPLRRADLAALADAAPQGPILGARVEHELAKDVLIQSDPDVFFTTPHFDGYPSILVVLDRIAVDDLEEVIVEAWLARAPRALAKAYVQARSGEGRARPVRNQRQRRHVRAGRER